MAQKSTRVFKHGVPVPRTVNKDGVESTQLALPQTKRARIEPEAPISPSVSSQKDSDLDMAIKQSLGPVSQQVGPIEIGPSARVSIESHTPEVTASGDNQTNTSNALVTDTHGEVHSAMSETVTGDAEMHQSEGGSGVPYNSSINSPVSQELDPSTGDQLEREDQKLGNNDSTPVDEFAKDTIHTPIPSPQRSHKDDIPRSDKEVRGRNKEEELKGLDALVDSVQSVQSTANQALSEAQVCRSEVAELKTAIGNLDSSLSKVYDSHEDDFKKRVEQDSDRYVDLKWDIHEFRKEVKEVKDEMFDLKKGMKEETGEIRTSLQAVLAKLNDITSKPTSSVSEAQTSMEKKVDILHNSVSCAQATLAAVDFTTATLKDAVRDLDNQNFSLTEKLDNALTKVDATNSKVDFLTEKVRLVSNHIMVSSIVPNPVVPQQPVIEDNSTKGENRRGDKGEGEGGEEEEVEEEVEAEVPTNAHNNNDNNGDKGGGAGGASGAGTSGNGGGQGDSEAGHGDQNAQNDQGPPDSPHSDHREPEVYEFEEGEIRREAEDEDDYFELENEFESTEYNPAEGVPVGTWVENEAYHKDNDGTILPESEAIDLEKQRSRNDSRILSQNERELRRNTAMNLQQASEEARAQVTLAKIEARTKWEIENSKRVGPVWLEAYKIWDGPQSTTVNDNEAVWYLNWIKSNTVGNFEYWRGIIQLLVSVNVSFSSEKLPHVTLTFSDKFFYVSRQFFLKRTLTEINAFMYKVPRIGKANNELLYDELLEIAERKSPEVCFIPYQIRYMESNRVHLTDIGPGNIGNHSVKLRKRLVVLLVTQGFETDEKLEAAGVIAESLGMTVEQIKKDAKMNGIRQLRVSNENLEKATWGSVQESFAKKNHLDKSLILYSVDGLSVGVNSSELLKLEVPRLRYIMVNLAFKPVEELEADLIKVQKALQNKLKAQQSKESDKVMLPDLIIYRWKGRWDQCRFNDVKNIRDLDLLKFLAIYLAYPDTLLECDAKEIVDERVRELDPDWERPCRTT